MSGYATVSDVEHLDAVLTFTATSQPHASAVARFCEQTAAELDGILAAQDYVVPVSESATAAHRLMLRYNAIGAHALALNAAPDHPKAKDALAQWNAVLKALRAGEVSLPGAARDTDLAAPRVGSARQGSAASSFFFREQDF